MKAQINSFLIDGTLQRRVYKIAELRRKMCEHEGRLYS